MFICLDIETTGLNNETDSIIEVAAIKFNLEGEIIDRFQSFVNYTKPIPIIIEHLTGINHEMTKNAPKLEEIRPRILEICGDLPIIGHNINFDVGFLKQNGVVLNGPLIDTLIFSHLFLGENLSFSLETLTRKFNKTHFPTHRAEDDVIANIELFKIITEKIKQIDPETNYLFKQILQKTNSPVCQIIANYLPTQSLKPVYPSCIFLQSSIPNQTQPSISSPENQQIQEILSTANHNDLFVISDFTYNKLKQLQHTKLPDIYSLILPSKFEQYLEQDSFTQEEAIFMLKIANQILKSPLLSKNDINFFGEDFEYLSKVLAEEYLIPESQNPYITNHYTFFKLLEKNLLPNIQNIHFENVPFLEETYIRSQEQRISLGLCEQNSPTQELTMTFAHFGIYASKLKTQKQLGEYNPLIIDAFDFTSQEFTEFVDQVSNLSQNHEVKTLTHKLKSNFNQLIVWVNISEKSTPSLSFIPQKIDFNLEQVLHNASAQNIYTYQADSNQEDFYINVDLKIPDPSDYAHNSYVKDWLFQKLKSLTGQAVIICTAKAQITELHKFLAPSLDQLGISVLTQDISGSKGKIQDNIENNENPLVLICTQHFLLRNIDSMPKLEQLFLTKLPMMLPNHIYYEFQKQLNPNSFNQLTIPACAQTLYQIAEFTNLQNASTKAFELLDKRIITKDWGQDIASNLPENIIITQS